MTEREIKAFLRRVNSLAKLIGVQFVPDSEKVSALKTVIRAQHPESQKETGRG